MNVQWISVTFNCLEMTCDKFPMCFNVISKPLVSETSVFRTQNVHIHVGTNRRTGGAVRRFGSKPDVPIEPVGSTGRFQSAWMPPHSVLCFQEIRRRTKLTPLEYIFLVWWEHTFKHDWARHATSSHHTLGNKTTSN